MVAVTWMASAVNGAEFSSEVRSLMDGYATEAKADDPSFNGFSAERGRELFYSKRMHSKGKQRGCTSCHTEDPTQVGRTQVGKRIEPISPAVTPERFTEARKVRKWFGRNCKWVLERQCTPREKGDFLTFMMSLAD